VTSRQAAAFGANRHLHDLICTRERHAAQKHLVDDREDRGIDANAEGQGEDSSQSKHRCVSQLSKSEVQVLE
jgi:hypothetical protein